MFIRKRNKRLIWMYTIKNISQLSIVSDDMSFLKQNVFNCFVCCDIKNMIHMIARCVKS